MDLAPGIIYELSSTPGSHEYNGSEEDKYISHKKIFWVISPHIWNILANLKLGS